MQAIRLLLLCAAALQAQDPFEINVYEYEPLHKGALIYETHLNYVASGTRHSEGALLPSHNQLHFSSEWTVGINDTWAAGFVLLTAKPEGRGMDYAGFRIVPHFYAPASWNLPFGFGLVTEFSSQSTRYEENSRQLEIRPILEKRVGRLDVDLNPVFSHSLGHQAENRGWTFEPAARIGWKMAPALRPNLEYYGDWGPNPTHQILPGADWELSKRVTWSFGVGWSNSEAAHVVIKSRFEFEFGRP